MKKIRTILATLAFGALALTACSTDPEPPATASSTTTADSAPTMASGTPEATTTTTAATPAKQLSDEALAAALRETGTYTDDQILSMTTWQAFACDLKPQIGDRWTVAMIRDDIQENYGFTPTETTARVLHSSCG
ncbi:hypothetical protein K8O93_23170 [Gordonia bronchialis]|uniref:hypothetical protein n=1 Tax=Gordonia bronchialis TaxID=2054 RepID=UPI001CBB92BF|nr:hypothetical protein [Gordonia bronchialis]UAK37908.1 hypothetical protein K8O93_23170 [Gordonia bronchialis]